MGQTIGFFARQTVVGTGVIYLSDPFEVSAYEALNLQLRVLGVIGTDVQIVVKVETAPELNVSGAWSTAKTFPTITGGSVTHTGSLTAADLSQYARGSVEMLMGADMAMTFSLIGVAREG